ncbi:DUF3530 family protein [Thalassotalea insulae]|nr:DUF3530 family protein [Thalassotalea insulae]
MTLNNTYAAAQQQEGQEQPAEQTKPTSDTPQQSDQQQSTNTDEQTVINRQTRRSKVAIAPPLDSNELTTSDLKHYLPAEEQQPLLVGPDQYHTLITTNAAANNKGVVILLADWQQPATSPKAINYLRQTMPEQGWTTISIQPPAQPANYPSTALTLTKQQQENKQALTESREQLAKVLAEVMKKAQTYPGIIIVVAEGHHSALLFSLYQQQMAEQPMTLISLSAFLNDEEGNKQSAEALAKMDLPVLDLYLRTDHGLVKQAVKLRKKSVNQALKSYFRQKELFNSHTSYYPEKILLKEINGWLRSQGW